MNHISRLEMKNLSRSEGFFQSLIYLTFTEMSRGCNFLNIIGSCPPKSTSFRTPSGRYKSPTVIKTGNHTENDLLGGFKMDHLICPRPLWCYYEQEDS